MSFVVERVNLPDQIPEDFDFNSFYEEYYQRIGEQAKTSDLIFNYVDESQLETVLELFEEESQSLSILVYEVPCYGAGGSEYIESVEKGCYKALRGVCDAARIEVGSDLRISVQVPELSFAFQI